MRKQGQGQGKQVFRHQDAGGVERNKKIKCSKDI